jgi:membrane protease YdiL (CAAX protease family)
MNALLAALTVHPWYDQALLAFAVVFMPAMSVIAGRQLVRSDGASLIPRYWFTFGRGWLAVAAVVAVWWFAQRAFAQLGLDFPIGFRGQVGFLVTAVVAVVAAWQIRRLRKLTDEEVDKALSRIGYLKIVPRNRAELSVFLLVALTAGVWEELVYRGFLLWLLAPIIGVPGAIGASAVIFGIGHAYQGIRGVIATALVGLVFALLYAWTASLWWLMLAHALIDVYGGMVTYTLHRMAAARHSPKAEALG